MPPPRWGRNVVLRWCFLPLSQDKTGGFAPSVGGLGFFHPLAGRIGGLGGLVWWIGLRWIVESKESLARPVSSTRLYPLVSFLASKEMNHTLRVTDRQTVMILIAYIFCCGPVFGSMVRSLFPSRD
jgi:hypothetical protein